MDQEMLKFILITFVVISLSLYIATLLRRHNNLKSYSFKEFLNDGPKMPSLNDIIVGMSFGIAMGFVDTVAIWLGVDQLGKYIKGGSNLKAAVGNMYSNMVAISVGSAVTIIMTSLIKLKSDQSPVYLNAIGSVCGALLGIFFSRSFLK